MEKPIISPGKSSEPWLPLRARTEGQIGQELDLHRKLGRKICQPCEQNQTKFRKETEILKNAMHENDPQSENKYAVVKQKIRWRAPCIREE